MMSHTRETRADASEVKFLIEPSLAPRVSAWARAHLAADPHGGGPAGDEYDVTTLYLDTPGLDVLQGRGSFGRAKYRIRRYGEAPEVFLERKLRKPGLLIKRRTRTRLSALERLREPVGQQSEWAGTWFERRMAARGLRAVCQVAYHRMARVQATESGLNRLTLDSQLRAVRVDDLRFNTAGPSPFLPDRVILEIKYRGPLPAVFKRLIEEFALAPATASKYRLAMRALGYGPAAVRPAVGASVRFNADFVRHHFDGQRGARWKVPGSPGGRGGMEYLGDAPDQYKRIYEIKTKDDPKAWADMIRMFRVLNETPPEKLEAALSPLLDIDGALKFLAIEVALVNSDGYWTRASDYNIYQDPKGRFHVVPHDMNEALMAEGGGRGGPGRGPGGPAGPGRFGGPGGPPPDGGPVMGPDGGPVRRPFPGPPAPGRGGFGPGATAELDPLVGIDDPTKPLRSRLLAVPALRERYLEYVRDIAHNWLDWKRVGPMVADWQAVIAGEVAADTRKLYSTEAFSTGLGALKTFVDRRREFLLNFTDSAAGSR